MLMMRTLLATVCCIFGSWGLVIELNFGSDFEHKVWSRFWSWSSGKIFELEFGQHFAAGNDICRVMKLNLGCDTLVSWTQPSGQLCLWQCLYHISLSSIDTRQSKQCEFSIYIFDNSKSKSMVKSEKMALSDLVFARKIARMILIQNI